MRWTLGLALLGEWYVSLVAWMTLGLSCFDGTADDHRLANHPILAVALGLLPVALVAVGLQKRLPGWSVPTAVGLVVLLHLVLLGVLLGALPYPGQPCLD